MIVGLSKNPSAKELIEYLIKLYTSYIETEHRCIVELNLEKPDGYETTIEESELNISAYEDIISTLEMIRKNLND